MKKIIITLATISIFFASCAITTEDISSVDTSETTEIEDENDEVVTDNSTENESENEDSESATTTETTNNEPSNESAESEEVTETVEEDVNYFMLEDGETATDLSYTIVYKDVTYKNRTIDTTSITNWDNNPSVWLKVSVVENKVTLTSVKSKNKVHNVTRNGNVVIIYVVDVE